MADSALSKLIDNKSLELPDSDLLLLMRGAILEQQKRFEQLNRRVTGLEERMAIDDQGDQEIGKVLEGIVAEISGHENRISKVENPIGQPIHPAGVDARIKLIERQLRQRNLGISARLGEEAPRGIVYGRVPIAARGNLDHQDHSRDTPPPSVR